MSGDSGMVRRRGSGLLVPSDLTTTSGNGKHGPPVVYDADGRRRVVIDARLIDRTAAALKARGIGIVIACREDIPRGDKSKPCGQVMVPEGRGTPDEGYGCQCTRIHVVR